MFIDMENWAEIRRRVLVDGLGQRAACREYDIHGDTLTKILRHPEPPGYRRATPRPKPKLTPSCRSSTRSSRTTRRPPGSNATPPSGPSSGSATSTAMPLRSLLPLAGLVIATAAPADEKTPEAILIEKGLGRNGVALTLKDAAARDDKLDRIEESARLVRGRLDPLRAQKQRLNRILDEAEDKVSRAKDEEEEELVTGYDSKGKEVLKKVSVYT